MSRRDEQPDDRERPEGPTPPATVTERQVARLFLSYGQGDPEAVAIAGRVIGRVVRAQGYYVPPDQRPDVVQEAMMDLVQAAKSASFATDDAFIAFARMVAHRRCVDWAREARRNATLAANFRPLVAPDDGLAASERRRLATDVFAALREPCRHLLALRVGRGLSYSQLAALLGRNESALRTQSYHCIRHARDILKRLRRRRSIVRIADWRRDR